MSDAQAIFRAFTKNLPFDKNRHQNQLSKLGLIKPKVPVDNQAAQKEDLFKQNVEKSKVQDNGVECLSTNLKVSDEIQAILPKKSSETVIRLKKADLNKHVANLKKFRKENNIYVRGSDIPDPIKEFNQLSTEYKVNDCLIANLTSQGYSEPTPVQMQCWPLLLKNREVVATAPTGSGKTAAFILPILHHLKRPRALGFRAIIVSPTRELADQTYRECIFLAEGTKLKIHLIDKVQKVLTKFGPKSSQKFDVLITTPNRLVYILREHESSINLSNVEWLVMDECDRLFEGGKSGFRDQLSIIYQACSGPKIKRGFFSATHSFPFQSWCEDNFDNLANVTIGQRNTASTDVKQELVYCGEEAGKIIALKDLLCKGFEPPCLIFVQSKERARQLFKELVFEDYTVDAIHSERSQKQREDCVKAFRSKKLWILICTELMSRGIDFKGVNMVINYDFPPTLVSHIHRIGRTGRAQQKGKAVTFWTMEDQVNLGWLARNMKLSGSEVPEWMLSLRKLAQHEKKTARKTKDRGFVSEGAKFTEMENDLRKKRSISNKLKNLKRDGKDDTEEGLKLKNKLFKVVEKQKSFLEKQCEIAEMEDGKRKRAKQLSYERRMKKKQKTE